MLLVRIPVAADVCGAVEGGEQPLEAPVHTRNSTVSFLHSTAMSAPCSRDGAPRLNDKLYKRSYELLEVLRQLQALITLVLRNKISARKFAHKLREVVEEVQKFFSAENSDEVDSGPFIAVLAQHKDKSGDQQDNGEEEESRG